MHHTIFDTPIVNTLLRSLSIGFLKLTAWKVEGGETANNLVAASVTAIQGAQGPLQLIVSPEGTRNQRIQ